MEGKARKIVLAATTPFFFAIWLVCYFCAVCSSPGYIPFYWAVDRGERFNYSQQMDGVITSTEQYDFANYNDRPERASLSKQARRIVLRADHICPWIANWVGLKNYRWFFLKLLWSFIYFLDWFVVFAFDLIDASKHDWHFSPSLITMCIIFPPCFGFTGFIVVMLVKHTGYSTHNTTTLQEFKIRGRSDKHNYYDLGCWRNCQLLMGPPHCCPCWFCPVPIKREWGGFHWETNKERPPDPDDEED